MILLTVVITLLSLLFLLAVGAIFVILRIQARSQGLSQPQNDLERAPLPPEPAPATLQTITEDLGLLRADLATLKRRIDDVDDSLRSRAASLSTRIQRLQARRGVELEEDDDTDPVAAAAVEQIMGGAPAQPAPAPAAAPQMTRIPSTLEYITGRGRR